MSSRAHATWAPSSCTRNLACPGNLALLEQVQRKPAVSSVYADYGTVAHTLSEQRLRNPDLDLDAFVGHTDVSNDHSITVDEEMVVIVQEYVDYIESRVENHGAEVLGVEVRLDLGDLKLAVDSGGTADCVLYYRQEQRLEVVDLKTGAGKLVEAIDNDQGRCYGVGALLEYGGKLPIEAITTTIVQPRIEHDEGHVRSQTISTIDLLDWVYALQEGAEKAARAIATCDPNDGGWVDRYLHLGDHCQFCEAMSICPAQRNNALANAEEWFIESDRNSPEEVEADLDRFELVEDYIAQRRALAHRMAEADPTVFPNWILVKKFGHRKYTETPGDVAAMVVKAKPSATPDMIYDKKLKSPAGLERSLGKAFVAAVLGDVIEKPEIGTDLVRRSAQSDKRLRVQSLTERFYDETEQTKGA